MSLAALLFAATIGTCPSDIPGKLAYASPAGIVLCRAMRPPVLVTTRADANAISFSRDGTSLRYRVGGLIDESPNVKSVAHVYTIAKGIDRIVKDDESWCRDPLPICDSIVTSARGGFQARVVQAPEQTVPLQPATLIVSGARSSVRIRAGGSDNLDIAAFSPHGNHLLFWLDPEHSASFMADAVPLAIVTLSNLRGNVSMQLSSLTPNNRAARSIVGPIGMSGYAFREWISFSPNGREMVAIAGQTRDISISEMLVRCTLAQGGCKPWLHRADSVELDPAWSPDGSHVAFVRAPLDRAAGAHWSSWRAKRRLVIANAIGNNRSHAITAAGGDVSWPTWLNANHVLFIANGRLNELDVRTGLVRKLVPLANRGVGYYGYVARSDRFAWRP